MGGRGSSGGNNPVSNKATSNTVKYRTNLSASQESINNANVGDKMKVIYKGSLGKSDKVVTYTLESRNIAGEKEPQKVWKPDTKGVSEIWPGNGVKDLYRDAGAANTVKDISLSKNTTSKQSTSVKSNTPKATTTKSTSTSKASTVKIPSFIKNSSNPRTVVTKIGSNTYYIDLAKSDVTKANIRSLEKAGWKRRGKRDDTWYKG